MIYIKDKKYYFLLLLLSIFAVYVSYYLFSHHILVHFSYDVGESLCSINKKLNCDAAARSSYSLFLGQPISLWGLGFYAVVFLWSLLLVFKPEKYQHLLFVSFLLFLGSVFYSIGLGLISWLILKVFCPFCLVLYFINITTFITLIILCRKNLSLKRVKDSFLKLFKSKLFFVSTFLYTTIFISGLIYERWWPENHPNSVLFYKNHEEKKLQLEGTNYSRFGNENASIRIDIFSDFQCPFCEKAHEKILKVLDRHPNKIVVYMHNFPLDKECNPHMGERQLHQDACEAARLALAIDENSDRLKDLYHKLFTIGLTQKDIVFSEKAKKLLQENGLSLSILEKSNSKYIESKLDYEIQEAISLKIKQTPSVYFNGYYVPKVPELEMLEKMLDIK